VRPLLSSSKSELLAYAREHKVRFREDATNASPDHLRNRIRNELLPLLRKKYQPGLDKTVLRLMDIIGADAEFVADAAQNFFRNRRAESQEGFARLPVAVQRKALQQQLIEFGLIPDFELVEHLRGMPGKPVSVGVGLTVACDASGTVVCREHSQAGFNPASMVMKLAGQRGRVRFGGRQVNWRRQRMEKFRVPLKKSGRNPATTRECFDASTVGDQIILRHWRPGDRFQPIGLSSAAKLQDLFVNARIPADRRRGLILATTAENEIFWVEGLRIGEKFKLIHPTRQVLQWTVGNVQPPGPVTA
jgi:tRNA(Ile)-lysidine synthase